MLLLGSCGEWGAGKSASKWSIWVAGWNRSYIACCEAWIQQPLILWPSDSTTLDVINCSYFQIISIWCYTNWCHTNYVHFVKLCNLLFFQTHSFETHAVNLVMPDLNDNPPIPISISSQFNQFPVSSFYFQWFQFFASNFNPFPVISINLQYFYFIYSNVNTFQMISILSRNVQQYPKSPKIVEISLKIA